MRTFVEKQPLIWNFQVEMGEKLTFVNFMKKITDRLAKIIFRQDVMGMWWVFRSSYYVSPFTINQPVIRYLIKSLVDLFLY